MRNFGTPIRNRYEIKKDISDKENMSRNVVGMSSSKEEAVNGVKPQTPLTFRKLNFQSIDDDYDDKNKPDITYNEDFSFDKLKGTVEDFEKKQKDRQQNRITTNSMLSRCDQNHETEFGNQSVKDGEKFNHKKMGCMNLSRVIGENKVVSNVPDLEIRRSKSDSIKVLKEKTPLKIENNSNKKSFTLLSTYSGSWECNQNEQRNDDPAPSKNERGISEKNACNFRRPMPEGDKINADRDVVSSSDECSSQGMLDLYQSDVVSLDIDSTNENARGGKRNSSKGCTTTRQDENSQPKWKRNRVPNDSEKTSKHSTCDHFMDEKDAMVTTNLKKDGENERNERQIRNPSPLLKGRIHSTFNRFLDEKDAMITVNLKKDSESERNERRLRNPSPLLKGRNFNPNRYKFTPKIKKEEVEATDNKNASVQKISEWLGNDPFGNKKQILIRQESKIMTKSKAFEHEDVIQMRNKEVLSGKELRHFPVGKVSQGKKWLQSAFGEAKEEENSSSVSVKKKKYEYAFKQSKR